VERAIKLGVKGFIVKPYTFAKLQDILNKYQQESSST